MCESWGVSELLAQLVSLYIFSTIVEVRVVGGEAFKSFERFQ